MLTAGLVVLGASLASPAWTCVDVEPNRCTFLSEYFAQQLAQSGEVQVTTAAQMAALLGMERQRQLMACDANSSSSCLAELAGALGADGIITANVAKVGDGFAATVRVVRSNGTPIAGYTGRAANDGELLDFLSRSAADLREKMEPPPPPVSLRSRAWIPAVGGAVLVIVGASCVTTAGTYATRLQSGDPTLMSQADVDALASSGSLMRGLGIGLLAAGGVALAVAGAMALFGGPVSAAAVVTPGGGGVSLSVRWP